jgi:transposase
LPGKIGLRCRAGAKRVDALAALVRREGRGTAHVLAPRLGPRAAFAGAGADQLALETEIINRSHQAKGFVALPKRWIVERTIAWLNRCRRLAKDWENLNRNALAFLKLASIRLMLRKLCNP